MPTDGELSYPFFYWYLLIYNENMFFTICIIFFLGVFFKTASKLLILQSNYVRIRK